MIRPDTDSLEQPFQYSKSSLAMIPSRLVLLALLIAGSVGLGGCYVPNVEQGNIVEKELVDKIKTDMSRQQVRYILGSPLVMDVFHRDRWDYYYLFRKGRSPHAERSRITIVFRNDRVVKVERHEYDTK